MTDNNEVVKGRWKELRNTYLLYEASFREDIITGSRVTEKAAS